MKLHMCCGDVYLKNYINIDIRGELSKNVPDNYNETTIDKYYKYNFKVDKPRIFIVDKIMNILQKWDFPDNFIEEVVLISAIEHFNKQQAAFIISEVKRVLIPGGTFIFDFPDLKKDIELYYESDPDFLMELIYCNQKNEHSSHKWGYTLSSVGGLLGEGWDYLEETIVKHDYPMIGIKATKK